jgi:transposase-like protein
LCSFSVLRRREVKARRSYTREFKLDLCVRIESGELTKAQASREHRLSPTVLDRWVNQFREAGKHAFEDNASEEVDKDRRIRQLEEALGEAHLDIKILREALLKKAPRSDS